MQKRIARYKSITAFATKAFEYLAFYFVGKLKKSGYYRIFEVIAEAKNHPKTSRIASRTYILANTSRRYILCATSRHLLDALRTLIATKWKPDESDYPCFSNRQSVPKDNKRPNHNLRQYEVRAPSVSPQTTDPRKPVKAGPWLGEGEASISAKTKWAHVGAWSLQRRPVTRLTNLTDDVCYFSSCSQQIFRCSKAFLQFPSRGIHQFFDRSLSRVIRIRLKLSPIGRIRHN